MSSVSMPQRIPPRSIWSSTGHPVVITFSSSRGRMARRKRARLSITTMAPVHSYIVLTNCSVLLRQEVDVALPCCAVHMGHELGTLGTAGSFWATMAPSMFAKPIRKTHNLAPEMTHS